jgi:glutamate-1-semialdehyde 2,1-aminomutase
MSAVPDRALLLELIDQELVLYRERHPTSREMFEQGEKMMLSGVPMSWMLKWAGASPLAGQPVGFPLFAERAEGAHLIDVDGNEFVDFCLGDTGAMTGHSPPSVIEPLQEQLRRGLTTMMPGPAILEASRLLGERFGLPLWQFTVSATDANRFATRLSRGITGREKILVFNHCYHGSIDEALATLGPEGEVVNRPYNLGPPIDTSQTTRVAEFNDLEGVERELSFGDVACVLAEPALTNVGIVPPEEGFHAGLRELTAKAGALLIIDETHTISVGPGGATGAMGLEPDLLTIGKAIGSGVPVGAWGLSERLGRQIASDGELSATLTEGIGVGGTLAGNAFGAQAIVSTLTTALTPESFEHTIPLATRWSDGVRAVIEEYGLPWHVTQLGARAEYQFRPTRPRNGGDLAQAADEELERYLRLSLINRGVLTTPFHNMALMSASTSEADVDLHTDLLRGAIERLFG